MLAKNFVQVPEQTLANPVNIRKNVKVKMFTEVVPFLVIEKRGTLS